MDGGVLLFWGFLTLVSLSIVWANHLSRREAERTIQMALERGVLLDAVAIRELRFGANQRTPVYLAAGGVILLSIALALTVFALIIAPEEPDTLLPLLGIAAFVAIPAVTMAMVGFLLTRWMRKTQNAAAG